MTQKTIGSIFTDGIRQNRRGIISYGTQVQPAAHVYDQAGLLTERTYMAHCTPPRLGRIHIAR